MFKRTRSWLSRWTWAKVWKVFGPVIIRAINKKLLEKLEAIEEALKDDSKESVAIVKAKVAETKKILGEK